DLFVAMAEADPAHYVRGQYKSYLDTAGVAPGSPTETFCAMRLEIDNWRWSGGPFSIPARKAMPATVTVVRAVLHTSPWPGRAAAGRGVREGHVGAKVGRQAPARVPRLARPLASGVTA